MHLTCNKQGVDVQSLIIVQCGATRTRQLSCYQSQDLSGWFRWPLIAPKRSIITPFGDTLWWSFWALNIPIPLLSSSFAFSPVKSNGFLAVFWGLLDESYGEDGQQFVFHCLSFALSMSGQHIVLSSLNIPWHTPIGLHLVKFLVSFPPPSLSLFHSSWLIHTIVFLLYWTLSKVLPSGVSWARRYSKSTESAWWTMWWSRYCSHATS